MKEHPQGFVLQGTVIQAPEPGHIDVLPGAAVQVDGAGNISAVEAEGTDAHRALLASAPAVETLPAGQYLLPGLVDLHVHAPQWPQLGKALHLPLYEWLQQCTFPLEAKYADMAFADRSYRGLVDCLLANGTTTALYFGTVHVPATLRLAEICLEKGQRAFIGKVAMDNPAECPDFYRDESTRAGLAGTRSLIEGIGALPGNGGMLVQPVVTPRFIPSCSDDMLTGLGQIAKDYDCHVQTHCSESDWEHGYVLDRHGMRDTASLDRFGLLTGKTVLAHCNFIDDGDMDLMHRRGNGIAHCPLSNFYFSNAVFPARRALDRGLNVGLGTDISGGPSPSLLHNCSVAVTASRALEEGVDPAAAAPERGVDAARIDFREAFWMATTGGARALGINVGRIAPGYRFDAIAVDTEYPGSDLTIWPELDDAEAVLQKILYNGGRDNIRNVWVQGRQVV